jgi:ABC-type glutathione transport system ATPase component
VTFEDWIPGRRNGNLLRFQPRAPLHSTISPLLEVRSVSKRFPGVSALENVSMSVGENEVLAGVGENGAGKSTLMKILAGVQTSDAGEILFKDEPDDRLRHLLGARRCRRNSVRTRSEFHPNHPVRASSTSSMRSPQRCSADAACGAVSTHGATFRGNAFNELIRDHARENHGADLRRGT